MKSSPWLWRMLGLSTGLCLLIMLAGFGWALKESWFPNSSMSIPKSSSPEVSSGGDWSTKEEIFITSLGDSLTKGTGDSTGEGYVTGVIDRLSKVWDKPVYLVNNLALDGLRTDQLVERLEEKGFQNAVSKADILLLTIGGNDLFQLAQASGMLDSNGELSPEQLEAQLPETKPRLKAVFDTLRQLNPSARLIYVGLYNPFYHMPEMRPASHVIAQWNGYAHELAEADGNATIVPTYDLFEFNVSQYLASDDYHPNAEGYSRIADRVVQALH